MKFSISILDKKYIDTDMNKKLKDSFIETLIADLDIILEGQDEYIIRYDSDNQEIIANISGDLITYYDMSDKQDRDQFIKDLFRFLNKMRRTTDFKTKKLELR